MVKTFKHNGKQGDIIYSLPTIRELGGGVLYIPEDTPDECKGMYSNMKALLELQPYIHEVREYPSGYGYKEQAPGIHIDYDLDLARDQPAKGVIHIVKRYMDAFGVKIDNWKEPWLELPNEIRPEEDYVLINYTGRHVVNERLPSKPLDWAPVVKSINSQIFFIGTTIECERFKQLVGVEVIYYATRDVYEVAQAIRGAKAIYCNQSLVLTLAQSLGKEYYFYPKPFKTNCILNTPNEYLLQ